VPREAAGPEEERWRLATESFGASLNLGTDAHLAASAIDLGNDKKVDEQPTFDVSPIELATNTARLRPSPFAASALVVGDLVRETKSDVDEQLIDHVLADWLWQAA
jgi:hypothetical protein